MNINSKLKSYTSTESITQTTNYRVWPEEIPAKNNFTSLEKNCFYNFRRYIHSGWFVIDIDPLGLSNENSRMGVLILENYGILTFSILDTVSYDAYNTVAKRFNKMVEDKITNLLMESPLLVKKKDGEKSLKFNYKHISILNTDQENEDIYSDTIFKNEARIIKLLKSNCDKITYTEFVAIINKLAPEYTVIRNEKIVENIEDIKSNNENKDVDIQITGNEKEYRTFLLDKNQVKFVNDDITGHRVLLANAGAGKSVLLLSKAYKYASTHKNEKVLLTCYNNNLASLYKFKNDCANFGDNNNIYIMTFHNFVKKIYKEKLNENIFEVTEDHIKNLQILINRKNISLSFGAIFIDEIQVFMPQWIDLCYSLLSVQSKSLFLMAGDLNQTVRKQSKAGEAPWKKIANGMLNFTGRVKYMSANYRNSCQISKYLDKMLKYMNSHLAEYGMIDTEYDYNVFGEGIANDIALNVVERINRQHICLETVKAIKEIQDKYKISYSDIAVIFPYKNYTISKSYKYEFIDHLKQLLDNEGIQNSIIYSDVNKKNYKDTAGIVLTTAESSLGLDFKAVILSGLYPLEYIYSEDKKTNIQFKKWEQLKEFSSSEKETVKKQMRKIYTSCSRAREVLYVLSDLDADCPMEDILEAN